MVQLKQHNEGFDYRIQVSNTNQMTAAVWMTARQKKRLQIYGDVLFLDGTESTNAERFCLFLPTILNSEKKIYRVAAAVCEIECNNAFKFILSSMVDMCPGWCTNSLTIFKDGKIGETSILDICPESNVHLCIWHWLSLDLPAKFSRKENFQNIITDIQHLRDQRTPEHFESCWTSFQSKHQPDVVQYMQLYHHKKHTWAKAWTHNFTTLGCIATSPSESSNASFKAWMLNSNGDLTSLLHSR